MDVSFQLLWVNTENVIDRSYGKCRVSIVRNCQLSFKVTVPFQSAMNESSFCSMFLPAFGVVSVLDFGYYNRCVCVFFFFN